MTKEHVAKKPLGIPTERGTNLIPTTLHLFSYHGSELELTRTRFGIGTRLTGEFLAAKTAMGRLGSETTDRIRRIRETQQEVRDMEVVQLSPVVASVAYLKMVDELSLQGLSPKEIMGFYAKCLRINNRISTPAYQLERTAGLQVAYQDAATPHGKIQQIIRTVLSQEVGLSPAWFKGDKKQWADFVETHGVFVKYLYPKFLGNFIRQMKLPTLSEWGERPHLTFAEALPDWFTESGGQAPDLESVQQELSEDRAESARLADQQTRMAGQVDYVRRTAEEKYLRAVLRFEKRRRHLLASANTFADAIIFLGSTEGMREYALDMSKTEALTVEQAHRALVSVEKSREQTLNQFTERRNVVFGREAIALWLEAQLKDGRIITTAQDVVDQRLIDIFNIAVEQIGQPEAGLSLSLEVLRTSDKRVFNFLRYQMTPLIPFIPVDKLLYIQELIKDYKGELVEPIIWEMADILAEGLNTIRHGLLPKQTAFVINNIKEFSVRWIRNNWKWAFQQLATALLAPAARESAERSQLAQPNEAVTTLIDIIQTDEELQAVETLIEDIQQGYLKGWHLYYTTNRRVDDSLAEIAGSTEEERVANFRQFIVRNGISCSIKPESVIRTFEWLVTVPQQVENIRMRKDVNGEIFKKIKRGALRIFYLMDHESKNIVFFIHQKKANTYGF